MIQLLNLVKCEICTLNILNFLIVGRGAPQSKSQVMFQAKTLLNRALVLVLVPGARGLRDGGGGGGADVGGGASPREARL